MDLAEVLADGRTIIELPEADPDDLIAAGEVLIQEGLSLWTVPFARRGELARLREVFGRRVRLGVSDLRSAADVGHALGTEPELLLSPFASEPLVDAAGDVPMVLGALTPTEVARALLLGAAGVQVIPCDALGSLYARTVTAMFAGEPLIATGRLERFQCEMWLDSGALAVCPLGAVSSGDVSDPDLTDLRHRGSGYRFG